MIIQKNSFQNFKSYGNEEYIIDLDESSSSLRLLFGKNGAGKSSILQALNFGIYGNITTLKNELLANIINKHCIVKCEIKISDNEYLHIKRGLSPNKLDCRFQVGGKDITASFGKRELQSIINDRFQIPQNIFNNLICINISDYNSFFEISQSERKLRIDKIFNLTELNKYLEITKETLKNKKLKLNEQQLKINLVENQIVNAEKELNDVKSNELNQKNINKLEINKEKEINNVEIDKNNEIIIKLNVELTELNNELIELKSSYQDLNEKIEKGNKVIRKFDTKINEIKYAQKEFSKLGEITSNNSGNINDYDENYLELIEEIELEIEKLKESNNTRIKKIQEYETKISDVNKKIKLIKSGKYPTCETDLTTDEFVEKKNEYLELTKEYELLKKENDNTIKDNDYNIKNGAKEIWKYYENAKLYYENKIYEVKEKLEKITNKRKNIDEQQDGLLEKQNEIRNTIRKYEKEIDSLKYKLKELDYKLNESVIEYKVKIEQIEKQIDDYKKDIKKIENEIIEQNEELEIYEILQNALGENGLKKDIFESIIPIINEQIKVFSGIVDNEFICELDSDFGFNITHKEIERDIKSLSTGQKKKLELCIIFAFYVVMISQWSNLNVLFLDEVFSGLDVEQTNNVLNVLNIIRKQFNLHIFCSHHQDLDTTLFSHIYNIYKDEYGFSQIELKQ